MTFIKICAYLSVACMLFTMFCALMAIRANRELKQCLRDEEEIRIRNSKGRA